MRFIFPSDYFNPKKADAAYLEQVACMQDAGFATSVVSLELLASGLSKIIPVPYPGSKVVYQGWIISSSDYELLVNTVDRAGANVLTS
jgi:hypothetical protein